jgi:hypothetical protein
MQINLMNIEDLIFNDRELQKLFPEFVGEFDQWRLSQRVPGLKQMGRRSVVHFLNSLKGEHIERLENYFGDSIVLDQLNDRIVENRSADLDALEGELCEIAGFQEFCLYRDQDKVHISFWR